MSTKDLYKLVTSQFNQSIPVGFVIWEKLFDKKLSTKLENCMKFIFNYLEDNKLKMFRWKILHFILPCNELLYKWNISTDNLCNFCKQRDVISVSKEMITNIFVVIALIIKNTLKMLKYVEFYQD